MMLVSDCQFTDAQKRSINALRNAVSDLDRPEFTSDIFISRWLKARSWEVDKAEKMLRANISWRISSQIDTLLSTFTMPEVISKFFPGGVCGHDKLGRPLFLCPIGPSDVFGLMKSATRSQLFDSQFHRMEYIQRVVIPQRSAAMGREVDQLVVIFDLQHMSRRQLWRPWLNFIQELITRFDMHYPEVMAVTYILNAPSFFSLVYSILKAVLSKETQAKMQVLGANYKEELLKYFDAENLPAYYGGTLTDPDGDPRCPSKICWGGLIPESYYLQSSLGTDPQAPEEGYTLVAVGRGGRESLEVGMARCGDLISWTFYTEANDITFSLAVDRTEPRALPTSLPSLHDEAQLGDNSNPDTDSKPSRMLAGVLKRPSLRLPSTRSSVGLTTSSTVASFFSSSTSPPDATPQQVIEPTRVDSDLVPETGQHVVNVEGVYHLQFDNSYSWTRAKRVWCCAQISPAHQNDTHTKVALSHDSGSKVSLADEGETKTSLSEEAERELELRLSKLLEDVRAYPVSSKYTGGNMDIDLAVVGMVLLQMVPFIKRRYSRRTESHQPGL